jgi:hypothetical protein
MYKLTKIKNFPLDPRNYWSGIPNIQTYECGEYYVIGTIATKPNKLLNVLFVHTKRKSDKGKGGFSRVLDFFKQEFEVVVFNTVLNNRFRSYLLKNDFVDGGEELANNIFWYNPKLEGQLTFSILPGSGEDKN